MQISEDVTIVKVPFCPFGFRIGDFHFTVCVSCSPDMSGMGAVERLDTFESWRPLLADLASGPRPGLRLSALAARGARLAPCLPRPLSRI